MTKLLLLLFFSIPIFIFGQKGSSSLLEETVNNTSQTSLAHQEEISSPTSLKVSKSNIEEEFSSEILKERLQKLDDKTPFLVPYNATVERFIRLYLKTKKEDYSNLMERAQYYFPIFEEHLDKYDLPLEIKYLAVVESALKPTSKSRVGAKGLWQFMYHTGKQYGLRVTSYVDERSDPIKATEAACSYLEDLYLRFNDWDLALAAYNSGPGNVSKAIKRSGGLRNYWNIRQYLPKETQGYLPAFYTSLYLFEYGAEHQIYPRNTAITYFETDTIRIKKEITFSQIQKIINIDIDLLRKLNPQYKLDIIPANQNYTLTLPKHYIETYISKAHNWLDTSILNREATHAIEPTPLNSYIVQENENITRIARKFNISVKQLKSWNGLQTNYCIAGQRLVVSLKTDLNHNK